MKKISRKLLVSSLSMAFATVALGTTTYAWFTTNAQVTADITVGVQSTGDSILISTDCFDWGSSVNIDASTLQLKPVTMQTTSGGFDVDDTFTDLDGTALTAGTRTTDAVLQFSLYLKVSSPEKTVAFDATAMDGEVTSTASTIRTYSLLKPFTAVNYGFETANIGTATGTSVTFATGNKIKVDSVNALRSVVDISNGGDGTTAAEQDTAALALDACWPSTNQIEMSRENYLVGFIGTGASQSTVVPNSVYNFGQSLAGNNAANSYISAVLGTNFTDSTGDNYKEPNATYAAHDVVANGWAASAGATTGLYTTAAGSANEVRRLDFTYWLEGYDADCFDAIMGQALSIKLAFKTL